MTSGLLGSIATSPIEYTDSSSKIASHVTPAFVVFHTPPEPTAMYQVLLRCGCTAISAIRPPINAGPISRNGRPATMSATSD